ncbi:hypothetical protein [Pseudomonas sichuanensis]|uniref:Uncharacterized protein n=1 Tax=Pseudomonas sichuanensis TaxID=2213015 RepID=A0ABV0DAZ1_9PSED
MKLLAILAGPAGVGLYSVLRQLQQELMPVLSTIDKGEALHTALAKAFHFALMLSLPLIVAPGHDVQLDHHAGRRTPVRPAPGSPVSGSVEAVYWPGLNRSHVFRG